MGRDKGATYKSAVVACVLGGEVANGTRHTFAQERQTMREVGGVAVGEQLCVPASINSMSVTLYRHPAAREGHSLRVEVDSSLDFLHQTLDSSRVCAELAVEERERVLALRSQFLQKAKLRFQSNNVFVQTFNHQSGVKFSTEQNSACVACTDTS